MINIKELYIKLLSKIKNDNSIVPEYNKPEYFVYYHEIEEWLEKLGVERFSIDVIHNKHIVDVDGHVNITREKLEHIPVQFGTVTGNFWCNNNLLTSLKGSPFKVEGEFSCNNNNLSDFKHLPEFIGERLIAYNNPLKPFKDIKSDIKEKIMFSSIKEMEYLNRYENLQGYIELSLDEFKKLQELKELNDKLSNDLSFKSDNKMYNKI